MTNSSTPKVACIILNWNGWRDTIECLESILHLNYPNFRVIVCDNASSDDSLERIKAWARGELLVETANPELSYLTFPSVTKPIQYVELSRSEAETNTESHVAPLTIIRNGDNLGFAGGTNVGLRYALRDPECQFFWMLNNDTVADPGALKALICQMQSSSRMGLCGSLTRFYANPEEVQTEGGNRYTQWTGRVPKNRVRSIKDLKAEVTKIDYVNGASMLASRDFLMTIGLMEESYFLYFEEMDWAVRSRKKFSLGCARDSVIFHKEGATIGSSRDRKQRSLSSEWYLTRNRVLFTCRYFPCALPTVLAAISAAALERICRGDWRRGRLMFAAMIEGIRCAWLSRNNSGDALCQSHHPNICSRRSIQ